MASPLHSNTVVAARCHDGGNSNSGKNVTPAGKDDAQQDGSCEQQQQFAADVGYRVASQQASRPFRCTVCDRQFASRKYLSMHMALHKMAVEPSPTLPPVAGDVRVAKRPARGGSVPEQWSCPICGKTFAQNSNFRNHMRTHSDERPYVCLVCLIGFKERYHLKKHMLFKHSPGQLNEACRLCGKRFKDLTAVRAHERTHSDVRPYACSRCSKMFKTSECLWHHENRSKTCCGRSQRSYCCEANASASGLTSCRRRQRRNDATCHLVPSTTSHTSLSTTTTAAAVATLPTHFVESSSAEDSTSSPQKAACCAIASGVKQETVIAELFDCDISTLWKTVASDRVALPSICGDNVDINFCTSTNRFDTATRIADVSSSDVEVVGGCGEPFWNQATPTDLSSQNNHCLQSSVVVGSSDASFQMVCGYLERRSLDQTTGCCMQQRGASDVFDEQAIPSCSTVINAYETGRSLKQSPANSQSLLELACGSGAFCGSNQALPTDVSPVKHGRHHGITSSPRHADVLSPVKTFHLPPIETFAPRPQQQRTTVARY